MKLCIFCIIAVYLTLTAGQQYSNPPNPYQLPPLPSFAIEGKGSSLPKGQQAQHQGLDWLLESVPGTPGTDYPIYSEEQLSKFTFACTGQVEGGYYADTASQCQAFHVCIPDGQGSLTTQSFLCPNGTIFNQEYFICDWWFNFDCSQATRLYSRNDEVTREREQASLSSGSSNQHNTYNKPKAIYGPNIQSSQPTEGYSQQ